MTPLIALRSCLLDPRLRENDVSGRGLILSSFVSRLKTSRLTAVDPIVRLAAPSRMTHLIALRSCFIDSRLREDDVSGRGPILSSFVSRLKT